MFVTFKSCPLMCSHRDLLLNSIHNNLPQNTLLPFWKSVISSILLLVNKPRTTKYSSVGDFILELNIKMTILITKRST